MLVFQAVPTVKIEHAHALEPDEVRRRLEGLRDRLAEKYGIDAHWKDPTHATFKRIGVSGSITCPPGKVLVQLDLSFALSPVKGKIEQRIREELATALA